MEVLKNGKDRTFKKECNKCWSIFRYIKSDIFIVDYPNPLDEMIIRKREVIRCPVCGESIIV